MSGALYIGRIAVVLSKYCLILKTLIFTVVRMPLSQYLCQTVAQKLLFLSTLIYLHWNTHILIRTIVPYFYQTKVHNSCFLPITSFLYHLTCSKAMSCPFFVQLLLCCFIAWLGRFSWYLGCIQGTSHLNLNTTFFLFFQRLRRFSHKHPLRVGLTLSQLHYVPIWLWWLWRLCWLARFWWLRLGLFLLPDPPNCRTDICLSLSRYSIHIVCPSLILILSSSSHILIHQLSAQLIHVQDTLFLRPLHTLTSNEEPLDLEKLGSDPEEEGGCIAISILMESPCQWWLIDERLLALMLRRKEIFPVDKSSFSRIIRRMAKGQVSLRCTRRRRSPREFKRGDGFEL